MKLPDWLRRPRRAPAATDPRPAVIDSGYTAAAYARRAHVTGQHARLLHVRYLSDSQKEVDLDEVEALAHNAIRQWHRFLAELAAERRLDTQLADPDPTDLTTDPREDPDS